METKRARATTIPNKALEPLAKLIGEWKTTGNHPLVPGIMLHGHSSFHWLEGGAFLIWHSSIDHPSFPTGIAIFGSDDAAAEYYMLYFDERNVSRKYNVSVHPDEDVLRWWRDTSNFSQRYTWSFAREDESRMDTIAGKGEISKDGISWERDLDLNFTRIQ